MNQSIEKIQSTINKINEEVNHLLSNLRKLEQKEEECHFLFQKNERIFQDLMHIFRIGDMKQHLIKADMEIAHYKRKLFFDIDQERDNLVKEKRHKEAIEDELYSKMRRLQFQSKED